MNPLKTHAINQDISKFGIYVLRFSLSSYALRQMCHITKVCSVQSALHTIIYNLT